VSDADVVAYTDVDLSTDLDALLPLVAPLVIGHSDLSIGSRLAAGARVQRGTRRELLSRTYNRLLHVIFGSRFRDAQCGFKAMRTDVARRLLPEVRDNGWFFDTELLLLAERNGLRITEVPVDWIDDADSRVALLRTALEDLQGMARMALQFWTGRGRLDLGSLERAPVLPGTGGEIVSFVTVGAVSTFAYLLLFFLLRGLVGPLASNAVALTTTMVANTAVNRRWTFGRSGPGERKREWARAAAVHTFGLALTSLALVGAEALDGGATTTELLLLGMASAVASLMRLLLMPAWVFRRKRR
jgi:putative flippase GtrA